MRSDSIGLFWEDIPIKGQRFQRPMPEIPQTTWQRPTSFPNLRNAHAISFDVETWDPDLEEHGPGWARGSGHIVGLAVGADHDGRWYFPMRHETETEWNIEPSHVLAWAKDTFANSAQPKIGANVLYDVGWLAWEGVPIVGPIYDVQFAEALIDESLRVNLDALGVRYLNEGKVTTELERFILDWFGGPKTKYRKHIYRAPPRLVGPYAEGDVDLPLRIIEHQWRHLVSQGLVKLFEMECALIPLLVAMRMKGVRVSLDKAEQARQTLLDESELLGNKLKDLIGFEVNVNASDSVSKAFDHEGLTYPFTEKGAPSFRKAWLQAHEHPLAKLITRIREVNKVRGTFVESYILEAAVGDRVYGSLHPLRNDENGAVSGRYAMSNPNLQNIPIRDKVLGPLCRGLFIPEEGDVGWIKKDHSQIEYRSLAHYAVGPGADRLRATYTANPQTDYHVLLQDMVMALLRKSVDRRPIKNLNFGLLYGMGIPLMIKTMNIGPAAGKELYAAYHEAAPFVKATMDSASTEAQMTGMITTILGRRSRFNLWEPAVTKRGERFPGLQYDLARRVYGEVKRAYLHKAINRRLQGTAADIMKMGMLRLWESGVLDVVGLPLLTVHDELDWSERDGDLAEAWRYVDHVLETALPLRVPLLVNTDRGPDWGACRR